MEEIKRLIQGEKLVLSKEALNLLVSYDNIVLEGVVYKSCELLQKHCCPSCSSLLLENQALQLQLNEEAKPSLNVMLREFLGTRYERTTKPQYSRTKLFHEVASFLRETYRLQLVTPSDPMYKRFLKNVVKDKSKNYKKLKIRQKIPDYVILLEGDTRMVYYKYDKHGVPRVVPRHLVHPKVFAKLVGET